MVGVLLLCIAVTGCTSPFQDLLHPREPENMTQVLSLHEEATIKNLRIGIEDVWVDTKYTYMLGSREGSFSAPTGYVYLFVTVYAVDERGELGVFTSPRTFGSQAFTVEDDRGEVYDAELLYVGENPLPMVYSLERGKRTNGTILFKVPEYGTIENITYTDPVYSKLHAVWVLNETIDELRR